MRFLTLTLAFIVLSACTTVPAQFRDDPELNDRSEEYVEGYFDGVRTGRHITGNYLTIHPLDVKRYRTDDRYREGWDAGLRAAIEAAP